MCLYYTQWFWATSPWSSVLSGVMCLVGGAPFRSLVGVSGVCMGEGPAKEKTEMRDSIKKPSNYAGWWEIQSVPQILGPAPWIWSLACAPAWDGIWCWWSKDRGWEKRSTRLQVLALRWVCVPKVLLCACVHVQHLAGELNSTGAVVSDEQGRMLSEVRVCWCHERGGAKTLRP